VLSCALKRCSRTGDCDPSSHLLVKRNSSCSVCACQALRQEVSGQRDVVDGAKHRVQAQVQQQVAVGAQPDGAVLCLEAVQEGLGISTLKGDFDP
jgi:hypothetical protein